MSPFVYAKKMPLRSQKVISPEHRWQMTVEKFVHLPQEDKEKILIKTMEIMVELESIYHKEIKTTSTKPEVKKKYLEVLTMIRNFIISEAKASGVLLDAKTLEEFQKISDTGNLNNKSCIYAGWVSTIWVDPATKNFYCLHPANNSKTKVLYEKLNKNSKCSASQIACNPMVFGLKNIAGETSFCADVDNSGSGSKSHNASYSCMKQALTVEKDLKTKTDSKEERFKHLAGLMQTEELKPAFNGLHDYIFKSCVCEDPKATNIHKGYQKYMRPHRTCLGMIQSLNEIESNSCTEFTTKITNSDYDSFIHKWNDFFKKNNNPPKPIGDYTYNPSQTIEKEYKDLIDSNEVKAYCAGTLPEKPKEKKISYECASYAECSKNPDGTYNCIVNGVNKVTVIEFSGSSEPIDQALYADIISKIPSTDVELTSEDKLAGNIKFKITPPGESETTLTCKASFKPEEVKVETKTSCQTQCEYQDDKKTKLKCSITELKKNIGDKSETIKIDEDITKQIPETISLPMVNFAIKSGELTFTCPVLATSEPKDDEAKGKCEIKISEITEGENKDKKVKATVSFSGFKDNKDPESFNWSEGVADEKDKKSLTLEKKTEEREISVKFGDKDDEKCVGKVPVASGAKNDEAKKFSIDLQADSYKDQDASISVKAIIKNDKSEVVSIPEGYKVSWTRSGTGASKVKDTKKQESKATGDNIDGKSSEAKPLFEGEFSTSSSGISAQRVEDDYTVTAHLVNANGKEESKDDEKIPLLKKSSTPTQNTNYNYNNGTPPRNAPTFQFSPLNTSSQGIQ